MLIDVLFLCLYSLFFFFFNHLTTPFNHFLVHGSCSEAAAIQFTQIGAIPFIFDILFLDLFPTNIKIKINALGSVAALCARNRKLFFLASSILLVFANSGAATNSSNFKELGIKEVLAREDYSNTKNGALKTQVKAVLSELA